MLVIVFQWLFILLICIAMLINRFLFNTTLLWYDFHDFWTGRTEAQVESDLLGTSRIGLYLRNWPKCDLQLHMTRVNYLLELTNVRSRSRKESGICIIEMIKREIFSKNLHLKFSWMLQFGSRSKTLQQNLTIVPTWDLKKDYPNDVLVKVPVRDLNIIFPSYIL